MKARDRKIWAEMARRKKMFHNSEEWSTIRLWGLFHWGQVSHLLKSGDLLTEYKRENKIIWARPSADAYTKYIAPLLSLPVDELAEMAGWRD